MRRIRPGREPLLLKGLILTVWLGGCATDERADALAAFGKTEASFVDQNVSEKPQFNPRLLRRFVPARTVIEGEFNSLSASRVQLGKMLFHEKRLSKSQEISCNSCHELNNYGVDGDATSQGHGGKRGNRNSPSVFHAAGHFEQFWDGRSGNVEEQAVGPILNPIEMAAPNAAYVVRVLSSMPEYVQAFEKAFPGKNGAISLPNVGVAIGAFERHLTTRGRWDEFLEGDSAALSNKEIEGLVLFTNLGCMVCHTGEFLGGSMYEKVGAVEPWPNQADQGRFEVTKQQGDRMVFKVPSLRNIEKTAPYFHDGTAASLSGAVRMMGKHQLGLDLEKDEVESIVTWLNSLTGQLPKQYLAVPSLPPSTDATPKADKT